MKLQNLQYFEKLIEFKNYSRVAEFFNVGQPTISMGIKRLEKEVGYDLVVHSSKYNDLILTPSGKDFHKYSKEVVAQMALLEQEIERQLKNFKINLGMPPMINHTYFSKLAPKLNKNTLAKLNVIENNSTELIRMLKQGKIDVAMLASIKPLSIKNFHTETLTKDKFKVIVSKNNKLAHKSKITFADVNDSKVIQMNDGYIQSKIFDEIKKRQFTSPEVVYRTSDYKMIKSLIEEDVGISFLLEKSINPEDNLVMIDPESDEIPEIYISLAWNDGNDLNGLKRDLIGTIQKSVKGM